MTVAFQYRPRRYGSSRRGVITSGGGYTDFTPRGGASSNILPLPGLGAGTGGGDTGGGAGGGGGGGAAPFDPNALKAPFPGAAYSGAVPDKGIVIWHDPALGRDRYFQGALELSPSAAVNLVAQGNARAGGMFGARDANGNISPLFSTPANPNPMPTAVSAGAPITELKAGATKPNVPERYVGPTGAGAPGQQFRNVNGTAIAFNRDVTGTAGGTRDARPEDITGAPGGLDQPTSIFDKRYPQGFSASADDIAAYLKKLGANPPAAIYDHGGMLEEPMIGHGVHSKKVYLLPRGSKVTANKATPEEKGETEDKGESAAKEKLEEQAEEKMPEAPVAHHSGARSVDVHVSVADKDEKPEPKGGGKETEPEPHELPDAPVARPRRKKAA